MTGVVIAMFFACTTTAVVDLQVVDLRRDCEIVEVETPTLAKCREYIDRKAREVRGDGMEMVLGTCIRRDSV